MKRVVQPDPARKLILLKGGALFSYEATLDEVIKRSRNGKLKKGKTVSLEGLMVSTLTMTDALAKLLIEKGVITDAEFTKKLLEKRAVYK